MAVKEKLLAVQAELKAPKGQTNTFGKYKYRSCEDILESVKPLLKKYKATLVISDNLELIGERYYIKATATFMDTEDGGAIENTAFARESAEKKGMDDSQVTGATSSYARKYALNGLFLIDDTKDADTDEFRNQQKSKEERKFDEKVEKDSFDIVQMDIKMPIMDGLEATKAIKAIRPELPIVALTANAFDSDRQLAMDAGCDDFLSKPVSSELCLKTIKKFLGE